MTADPVPHLEARDLLQRHGLHAKKSWGQNFLVDERAYAAIVAACALGPGDAAVEIGAGLGTLTSRLLETGARVVAIERERDMCAVLRSELGAVDRFNLREENALSVDYAELARELGPPIVLVGNLPYQIASPLLFCFLAARPLVRRIVVMLQREVADRLLAQPGTDDYSALSAQVQLVARVRRVCHVGRGGFVPPPRIDSTVVLLEPQAETIVPVRDLNRYSQVVRAAFGQRRKTLRNALGSVFGEAALPALVAAGIDPGRRGETLNIADFARLADALHGACTTESADGEPG
ncbi:MAG: 16S rRNA (adenine(1518)-N(6)/adenine(1519)-N(6))-dimethyltransferase RsmA [Polyangia bacterium]